jgi:hypothetical protein
LRLIAKVAQGTLHLVLVGIKQGLRFEAHFLQRRIHLAHVAWWVGERRAGVLGVADEQRHTLGVNRTY